MKRRLNKLTALAAAMSAIFYPGIAVAQDEDLQFWLLTSASGQIDEDTHLTVDATYRVRENARGGDERTLRFLVEQEVSDFAKIGGGVGVFEAAGGQTQIRLTQQVALKAGRFDSRTRLEERFFDGADQLEFRFRQRVRYTHPLSEKFRAQVSIEWLHLLQPKSETTRFRDQFRPQIGVSYLMRDDLSIGLNYLAIISPRGTQRDRINHIPQAGIALKF